MVRAAAERAQDQPSSCAPEKSVMLWVKSPNPFVLFIPVKRGQLQNEWCCTVRSQRVLRSRMC